MSKLGDKLRPCEVSGHQSYMKGLFHGFYQMGKSTYALIETDRGTIHKVDMVGTNFQFTDAEEVRPGVWGRWR